MLQNPVPVNVNRHAATRIKEIHQYHFAANDHVAYITVHEFVRAAGTYPIVFIEDKPNAIFRPVVLLGLQEKENVFIDAQGKWRASYIPAIIRRHPFMLFRTQNTAQEEYVVCIDEASDLLSTTEGAPLFSPEGKPTQIIENIKKYLAEFQQLDTATREFSRLLVEQKLLTPMNMRIREQDHIKNISGCYIIHEEKLNQLPVDWLGFMRDRHYLSAIYAQLISLVQIERLSVLHDEHSRGGASRDAE